MSDFQRVKDPITGEEYSARRSRLNPLDKPAVDKYGRRLPNKPKVSLSKKDAEKKDPTNGAEPANTPKEGS